MGSASLRSGFLDLGSCQWYLDSGLLELGSCFWFVLGSGFVASMNGEGPIHPLLYYLALLWNRGSFLAEKG